VPQDPETVTLRDYIDQRFASLQRAVDKAEEQLREKQASANEWREAMKDREGRYLARSEFYTMITTAVVVATLFGGFAAFLLTRGR
jgi:hypothetical protein